MPAAVAAEPRIAEALHMRLLISKVTTTAMDVWDFDVWAFSHEELVAHLCQMFMQQGLCQSRVRLKLLKNVLKGSSSLSFRFHVGPCYRVKHILRSKDQFFTASNLYFQRRES